MLLPIYDRFDRLGEHDFVTVSMERIVHIVRIVQPAPERRRLRIPWLEMAWIASACLLAWAVMR